MEIISEGLCSGFPAAVCLQQTVTTAKLEGGYMAPVFIYLIPDENFGPYLSESSVIIQHRLLTVNTLFSVFSEKLSHIFLSALVHIFQTTWACLSHCLIFTLPLVCDKDNSDRDDM